MAVVRESAGGGAFSGVLGNAVYAQTQGGTVVRSRPSGSRRRSDAQMAQARRLERVRSLWDGLTDEEFQAWRDFALRQAERNPRTGGLRMPSAYSLFTGLGSKYLQVHGGFEVPRLPPEGRFLGDVLDLSVEGAPGALAVTSVQSNREGVLTELLTQRLTGRHNVTRPKSYVHAAFLSLEAGVPVEVPIVAVGYVACAVRYVESATGRMTELLEIGRAFISPTPETAI